MPWSRKKTSLAVSAALAGTSANIAQAQIEEIIVTATKRAESAQDVPISVQAVAGDDLRELRVETFDQYVEYLPNVVGTGNGPGRKELYIRGSATEQAGVTVAPAQGSAPGVALYVDEQPVSFGGRNLDVYAVDLERVEVLAGPQGTLFGASSQSGNLRLITNKPQQGLFGTGFNARFGSTHGGAGSGAVDAWLNLPLGERSAVRVAVYSDTQGGWIDNVPNVFTPSGEVIDRNDFTGFGPRLTGADSVQSAVNEDVVQDDWNEASYRGARIGFAHDIDDDWDLLVQHTAQTLESEGSFLAEPHIAEDASGKFAPEYNRDEFGLTTWTLNGRLSQLELIYTGGLLDREVDSLVDYTHYNNGGGYITYYLCSGNIYDLTDPNHCFDPRKHFVEDTRNRRVTHEFRVHTDPARRWRVLGGVYFNDVETNHVGDFNYNSTNRAFGEHANNYYNDNSGDGFLVGNIAVPTDGVNTSGPRGPLTTFFNDFTRTEAEVSAFGEIAFDLTDSVTASFSARSYDLDTALTGASNFSFGCRYGIGGFGNSHYTGDGRCNSHAFSNDVTARLRTLGRYNESGDDSIVLDATSPDGARGMFRGGGSNRATLDAIENGHLNIGELNADGSITETDTIVKATLDWQAANDVLLFATYAEGYRPATLNRNAGQLSTNQTGVYENYVVPVVALTDNLTSFEVGVKSDLLDRSLRLNATWFRSFIDELQVSRFDPSNVAFLFFIENIGDAESSGLDVDFLWLPTGSLSIAGAFSVLDTELTRINPQLNGIAVPVGSELPMAPSFAGNLRLRYDFRLANAGADAYVAVSMNHRGKMVSGIVGSAELMDDTLFRQAGAYSGLALRDEGGAFGTVRIPDGAGGRRLPANSRFVNPAATTLSAAVGMERDNWAAELFVDNLNNESAPVMQIAGFYTPAVTVQRPRTIGLRLSYDFE